MLFGSLIFHFISFASRKIFIINPFLKYLVLYTAVSLFIASFGRYSTFVPFSNKRSQLPLNHPHIIVVKDSSGMVFKSMGSAIVIGGDDVIQRYSIVTLWKDLPKKIEWKIVSCECTFRENKTICHRFDLFDVCNVTIAID